MISRYLLFWGLTSTVLHFTGATKSGWRGSERDGDIWLEEEGHRGRVQAETAREPAGVCGVWTEPLQQKPHRGSGTNTLLIGCRTGGHWSQDVEKGLCWSLCGAFIAGSYCPNHKVSKTLTPRFSGWSGQTLASLPECVCEWEANTNA